METTPQDPDSRVRSIANCVGDVATGGQCSHVVYSTAAEQIAFSTARGGVSTYAERIAYCSQTEAYVPGTGVVPRPKPAY